MKIKMLRTVYDNDDDIKIWSKGEIIEVNEKTKNDFYIVQNKYGVYKKDLGKEFTIVKEKTNV